MSPAREPGDPEPVGADPLPVPAPPAPACPTAPVSDTEAAIPVRKSLKPAATPPGSGNRGTDEDAAEDGGEV